jgi:hypothetical protein
LENHEACLATVETLEREIEALERDKETLSERNGMLHFKHQLLSFLPLRKLLSPPMLVVHQLLLLTLDASKALRQGLLVPSGRKLNNWCLKCSIALRIGTSDFGALLVYRKMRILPP